MIKLVLFDIDGTLIYTSGAGQKAFDRAFALEFGLANSVRNISFAGRTDPGIVREVFARHQIEPSEVAFEQFYDAYVFLLDHFLDQLPGGPQPGVWDWIHGLRALPEPPVLGLLTGNIRLGAEIKLRRFGMWEHFETGGFADDHMDRNRIARAARERGEALLGGAVGDEEVLVIGDTPLDIACARHIGARALTVATGKHSVEELLEHRPDWAAKDLSQLRLGEVFA